ncbi:hypothetical protein LZ30DRAFT_114261 [Colletotrichum cereale]|nr:hypothetical protein LZ30DRAFT_114261 [Colletotrichum cereale]
MNRKRHFETPRVGRGLRVECPPFKPTSLTGRRSGSTARNPCHEGHDVFCTHMSLREDGRGTDGRTARATSFGQRTRIGKPKVNYPSCPAHWRVRQSGLTFVQRKSGNCWVVGRHEGPSVHPARAAQACPHARPVEFKMEWTSRSGSDGYPVLSAHGPSVHPAA